MVLKEIEAKKAFFLPTAHQQPHPIIESKLLAVWRLISKKCRLSGSNKAWFWWWCLPFPARQKSQSVNHVCFVTREKENMGRCFFKEGDSMALQIEERWRTRWHDKHKGKFNEYQNLRWNVRLVAFLKTFLRLCGCWWWWGWVMLPLLKM